MPAQKGVKGIAKNRAAFHNYYIEERYEAGIELCGTEVKSIRAGKVNLKDSFCQVKGGELFIYGMHISPYEKGNVFNRDPRRDRRLLMHKREIMRLYGRIKQDGYALIPLSLYFKNARVKVEIGLAKGKSSMISGRRQRTQRQTGDGPDHENVWQKMTLLLCA